MFYPFLIKSLIVSFWLGIVFSILGILVIVKRMSFFSDGIAHASVAGLAIAFLLGFDPLLLALISALFFAYLIYFLERKTKIHTDTLIGLIFVSALSLGLILMSQKSGYQPELLNFLIGNVLAISDLDFYLTIIFASIILILLIFLFPKFLLVALDPIEAKLRKINVQFYEILFYLILAVSVILGIKLVGVILVTAFLILPPATSSLISPSMKNFIFLSIIFSIINIGGGFLISNSYDFPLGASIVLFGAIVFFFVFAIKYLLKIE